MRGIQANLYGHNIKLKVSECVHQLFISDHLNKNITNLLLIIKQL